MKDKKWYPQLVLLSLSLVSYRAAMPHTILVV